MADSTANSDGWQNTESLQSLQKQLLECRANLAEIVDEVLFHENEV